MATQGEDRSHCPPVGRNMELLLDSIFFLKKRDSMETEKEHAPSFFELRSLVVKPPASFAGQSEAMRLLLEAAGTDEPALCYRRQNATGLQLCHSSVPTGLATLLGISV